MKKKIIGKILNKEENYKATPCYMKTGMGYSVHELRIFRMKQKFQKSLTKRSIDCYSTHIGKHLPDVFHRLHVTPHKVLEKCHVF